jgi:hypothetical protein
MNPATTRLLFSAALGLALATTGGCSGDDGNGSDSGADVPADNATLLGFGETCAADAECASGICFETTCTHECDLGSECPADGWMCGLADAGRILCVTTRTTDGDGRYGDSCFSTSCDEAAGFRCIRRTDDDAYAYCTHDCTDDRDCPYLMSCRDGAEGRICRPRTYCEPCILDDQCGYANDDCIPDDAGQKFCSQVCDPVRPSTCPTDSLCQEIPAGSGRFQCKPSFGRCVGDGNICEPCRGDDDCNTGGLCITDRYTKISFCGEPCTDSSDCPTPEYYCTADSGQCRPKKGSCLEPSGGQHTCGNCADFSDCYDGFCLDSNGDGRGESCGDTCDAADPDACGPWGTCYRLTSGTTTVGYACMPHEGMACWQYVSCVADCPSGPTGCSRSYCR